MADKLTSVLSVRLPRGMVEEVRDLSGRPASEMARNLLELYVKQAKATKDKEQQNDNPAG